MISSINRPITQARPYAETVVRILPDDCTYAEGLPVLSCRHRAVFPVPQVLLEPAWCRNAYETCRDVNTTKKKRANQ